jgi:pilus assembly protein CpaC
MIAGLMSANSQNLVDKAPGLGDVPILGNLFRSREFRRGETELVIIVTPYLVKPVDAKDIRLPTDGFQTANEFQQLLGYQNNSGVSGQERPGPTAAQPDVPVPMIGNADPAALVPMVPQEPRRSERKGRKATREASAATPGFSF